MTKRTPGPDPFNNPFGKVKLTEPAKAAAAAKPPPPKKEKPQAVDAEAALFLEAMGEITPVKTSRNRPPPQQPKLDPVKLANDESESLAELAELVAGDGPFQGGAWEGTVPGLDPQVLRRLRGGEFARKSELDLHGLTKERAREAVEKFILQAHQEKVRCVLLITGRGLNSEGQIPVLKHSVGEWLTRGRLARHLLAFCPALPKDGGDGAVYVLLRR